MAVAEAYVAMRIGRPYRPRKTEAEATAELKRLSGKQFDPDIVNIITLILELGE